MADLETGRTAMVTDKIELQGKTFTVVKVNPKNLVIKDEADNRYNLPRTARYKIVGSATYADIVREAQKERADFSKFVVGVVVKVDPTWSSQFTKFHHGSDQAFVVMKHNYDLVNIVKLGGDGGRYWRVPPTALEIVEVA